MMKLKLKLKIENDILIATFPKNAVITELVAKQMVEERLAFQKGVDYPVLIYLNGVKFMTPDASNYLKNYGHAGFKSVAFIITNAVENMLLRFFISKELTVPTKSFYKNDEGKAIEWLNQTINQTLNSTN